MMFLIYILALDEFIHFCLHHVLESLFLSIYLLSLEFILFWKIFKIYKSREIRIITPQVPITLVKQLLDHGQSCFIHSPILFLN